MLWGRDCAGHRGCSRPFRRGVVSPGEETKAKKKSAFNEYSVDILKG